MAAKGGHIDFMFLCPPPLTQALDPLLHNHNYIARKMSFMCLKINIILVVTFGQRLFGTDIIKPISPTLPSLYLVLFSSCRSFGSQSGASHRSHKNEYRKEKRQAWKNLVNVMNTWNQVHGTGVTCSAKSIKTLE